MDSVKQRELIFWYNLGNFVRYNIMKCQAWLLVTEGSKTFGYLISEQKYSKKSGVIL